MELLLSSLAVCIAALALKKASEPKTVEIRYVVTRAKNQPLPPLPSSGLELPWFVGGQHVN
jgi:hypothetical protein